MRAPIAAFAATLLASTATAQIAPPAPEQNLLTTYGVFCGTLGCPPPAPFGDISSGSSLIYTVQGTNQAIWLPEAYAYAYRRPSFSPDVEAWLALSLVVTPPGGVQWGYIELEGYVLPTFPSYAPLLALVDRNDQCAFQGWDEAMDPWNSTWLFWGTCSTQYEYVIPEMTAIPPAVFGGADLTLLAQPLVWTNPAGSWMEVTLPDGTVYQEDWSSLYPYESLVLGKPVATVLK